MLFMSMSLLMFQFLNLADCSLILEGMSKLLISWFFRRKNIVCSFCESIANMLVETYRTFWDLALYGRCGSRGQHTWSVCVDASFEALRDCSGGKSCAFWTRSCSLSGIRTCRSHFCSSSGKCSGTMASTPWELCLTPRCQLRQVWLISACVEHMLG